MTTPTSTVPAGATVNPSTAPYTSVTTPSMPGTGQPGGGGIGGFLKDNAGLLIGGLLGGVLMMMTGGSGILGMLMPLIGALLGGMFGDKNGLLGGVRTSLFGGPTPAGVSGPQGGGPAPVVGVTGPGAGVNPIAPPAPIPQTTISWGGDLPVRNATGQVINGVAANGTPTYGAPTGTGPAARGPEISIIENAAPGATGAPAPGPAYQYTGFVRGDKFVITSVAGAIPGTTPPRFGAPISVDSRPGSSAVELPIGADGKISLNTTANPNPALDALVVQARERAARAGTNSMLDVSPVGGTAPANAVKVELEPVTRDGVTYATTMTGTRNAAGTITFNQVSIVERRPDPANPSGPPLETPVVNPASNNTTFTINPPINAGEIAGTPPKVALSTGITDNIREAMASRTIQIRSLETANQQARVNDILTGVNTSPTAGTALNAVSTRISAQLQAGGLPQNASIMAGETVANYYSNSANRNGPFNRDAFDTELQRVSGLGGSDATSVRLRKAITDEVSQMHDPIRNSVNGRPVAVAGTAATPTGPATSTQNLTRPLASTPPAPGAAYTPLATPNVNPAVVGR